jgi:hypothetical protein
MAIPVLSDQDLLSTAKILNVPVPSAAGDAANKSYVDTAIAAAVNGLAWKDAARVLPPANVNIASPGASLDSVAMAVNDRVLLANQSTAAENGVYIWNGAAVAMTRAADFDATAEVEGAVIPVEEGTTNTGTRWFLATANPTIGVTALVFTNLQGATPSASTTVQGIIELAIQAEVDAGVDAVRAITPATLAGYSGRKRVFPATIGDGAATQYDVTHSFNTTDTIVEVYQVSSGKRVVVETSAFSVNVTRINFATAPALNAYRVVVLA